MANGYKAPSGLSSAVRGRSMVQRDYTAGIKQKAADRRVTLGIVQGIAGGVADVSTALGENVKSWEQAEKGAREVFESSGIEGTFEKSGYKGASGWMEKYFKSAGEVSDTQIIGDREFSTSNLVNIGKVDSVTAAKMADKTYDESGNPTGNMSLYESEGKVLESGVGGITSDQLATAEKEAMKAAGMVQSDAGGTTVIKNNNQEEQKQNAVTPSNKTAEVSVGDITVNQILSEEKASKAKAEGAKTGEELATEESDGAFGGYTYDNKTGMPTASKVNLPKSRSDMTMWEKHLDNMSGKSKYFKNEEEFLSHRESLIEKLKKHNQDED